MTAKGMVYGGALLGCLLWGSARASAVLVEFYDVAAQPLRAALIEFAREAGMSIDFSGLDFGGVRSRGTRGNISRTSSLRALLAGTGFDFRVIDARTVQIFRVPPPAAPDRQPTPAPAPDGKDAVVIEDVVVTALKRPTAGFRLPVSVSAVSSLVLDDLGTFDIQSLAPHLAGVSTTNLGPGRNKLFVRGLSDGAFSDRTQALVGVYIDETPINFSDTNPDIRLFDVDRVELVRGPQGTLYGAGTLGGLYRIVTTKPVLDEASAKTRLTLSHTRQGGPNGLLDVAVNVPLVEDKLAFRLTGSVEGRAGYIDDIALGLDGVNDLSIYGARPALRWQVDDNWTLDASVNVQAIHYDDSQYFFEDLGRNRRENALREPYDDRFLHASLTLTGRIGDVILTSASAFVDRNVKETADATAGPFDVDSLTGGDLAGTDLSRFNGIDEAYALATPGAIGFFSRDDITTISHETRLRSRPDDRFEWLLGLFYLGHRRTMNSALAFGFDGSAQNANSLGANSRNASVAFTENRRETNDDLAVFGEIIYRPWDRLSITGGLRYSYSFLDLDYTAVSALDGEVERVDGAREVDNLIPKLALRYEWSDSIQTHMQVAVGYRVGGLNINTPLAAFIASDPDSEFPDGIADTFQSDTLVNYEVGLKSYWFDRRLSLDVSAFYVRWFDIQSEQIGVAGLPFVTNVGTANSHGYEVEFSANPLPGLEIMGSFFWNDSELAEDNTFLGAEEGDRLPTIPEYTASAALFYRFDITPGWSGALSGSFVYTGASSLTFDEDDSPRMGDLGLLNVQVQATGPVWKLGIFAENLADTRANTFAFGNSFSVFDRTQITPPRPRTIGLFIQRAF
ncbi:TonB-dependent receptor domain-containing protein [Eilatimonas milleporae]|uniref:Outer membrane receptor protein involved in Fe transport n=1 Tax=Eilatimonas milleporae TaxID=911205 RepID=A0A3M0CVS9_9PROT|nr:TonB-dependent receptor [Eilatimonas milleporae]RMB07753.1 outer membrane receptor protein involved in Fe transport [Eilatimonas milleporae]